MPELAPEAYVDALVILNDAPASVTPISVIEMHLYSYLGCVLALFNGQPIGDWGYSYAVTSEGFPFSAEFEDARKIIERKALGRSDERGFLTGSQSLTSELETVLNLGSFTKRRGWLRAATECALALPVNSIRYAVNRSPGMDTAVKLGQRRHLLEDDDITLLYSEYELVTKVLGSDAQGLLSPAVIWLSAHVLHSGGPDSVYN